jgi:hypothetical protein
MTSKKEAQSGFERRDVAPRHVLYAGLGVFAGIGISAGLVIALLAWLHARPQPVFSSLESTRQ